MACLGIFAIGYYSIHDLVSQVVIWNVYSSPKFGKGQYKTESPIGRSEFTLVFEWQKFTYV
jgi:hypothetical protein